MRDSRILTVLIALAIGVTAGNSFADGIAFKAGDKSSYSKLKPNEQRAVIHHEQNRQSMQIALQISLKKPEKALWIFPVRGKPDEIELELRRRFKSPSGKKAGSEAFDKLAMGFDALSVTQVFPVLMIARPLGMDKLEVFQQVDRFGLHTELVRPDNLQSLRSHLRRNDVSLENRQIDPFSPYLSGNYSLVLCWIRSEEELKRTFGEQNSPYRMPALKVTFPTSTPFYPLKATSYYGNEHVPIVLYVNGTRSITGPETFRNNWSTDIFLLKRLNMLGKPPPKKFRDETYYTRIVLRDDIPASTFLNDLRMPQKEPSILMTYAEWVRTSNPSETYYLVGKALLCLFISYIVAGITAVMLGRTWFGNAWVGLGNLFTIAGVIILLYINDQRENEPLLHRPGLKEFLEDYGKALFILILLLFAHGYLSSLPGSGAFFGSGVSIAIMIVVSFFALVRVPFVLLFTTNFMAFLVALEIIFLGPLRFL